MSAMDARTEHSNRTAHLNGALGDLTGRAELATAIAETVGKMPERMRTAFVLSHYRGHSLEEIAGRIGVREEEAASLLECADRNLYHSLKPFRSRDLQA